jgi:hypothetical protein
MKETNYEKEIVKSKDIYEIAYFLTKTVCKIDSIELSEEVGKPVCVVTVSGDNLRKLQLDYLNSRTSIDVLSYRKSLSYVRSIVYAELNKSKHQGGTK